MTLWSGILRYQNSANEQGYKALAEYALACLTTPVSNAFVERVFSLVKSVKTKARNRMKLPILTALLRLKTTLQANAGCCRDFRCSKTMLDRLKATDLYMTTGTGSEDTSTADTSTAEF